MSPTLPNLFIIGAAKSGTTTLYSILSEHPQIYMCSEKSPRFFLKDKFYNKGLAWYAQTFFKGAEQFKIRGEATPSYLANAYITAPRIKQIKNSENIKFIAIFRNPVERAYSHYWYNVNKKYKQKEDLSFEDAIQFEQKRELNQEDVEAEVSHTRDYLRNGEYSLCLMEYFKYFKREQFLLLLLEDLHHEKFDKTTALIAEFLGVDSIPIKYRRENPSRKIGGRASVQFVKKQRDLIFLFKAYCPQFIQNLFRKYYMKTILKPVKYPPMKESTKAFLLEKYLPSIIELEKIMGRNLSHWKK